MTEHLDPEDLVWAAIHRLDLSDDPDLDVAPISYNGLFVDVSVAGGPGRIFELDEDDLQPIIDTGDSASVQAAVEGIMARIEFEVREALTARELERLRGPVIALDIDGVLSPDARPEDLGPGWVGHQVEIPADDVPDSPFVACGGDLALSLPVVLNPGRHASWITRLRERADPVWATTWEEAANTHLAPLLGIGPLPVGISVAVEKPRFGVARDRDAALWKAMSLARRYAGRPLVWIDDQNHRFAEGWFQGQPTLIVTTDPRVGLTVEQMREVDVFVREHRPACRARG